MNRTFNIPRIVALLFQLQVIFSQEFDEFNDYIRENIDEMTKRLPKEVS
jgi:hypothetical protein